MRRPQASRVQEKWQRTWLKRSSQKLGEKRFRALQTDKDAPLNAAQSDARAPPRPASGATETNMTICTSSSIRTLTVGSGLSPDLLTLQLKPQRRRSRARRLALHEAPPAYRRWGISPRPEDVLITGSIRLAEHTTTARGVQPARASCFSLRNARARAAHHAAHPSAAASPHSRSRETRALPCRRDCAGCAAGQRRRRSSRPSPATGGGRAR